MGVYVLGRCLQLYTTGGLQFTLQKLCHADLNLALQEADSLRLCSMHCVIKNGMSDLYYLVFLMQSGCYLDDVCDLVGVLFQLVIALLQFRVLRIHIWRRVKEFEAVF